MKWECTSEGRNLTESEVSAIIELKLAFDQPMQLVRQTLDMCDSDCPNQHHSKVVHECNLELYKGHPIVCYNGGGCLSKLRILTNT